MHRYFSETHSDDASPVINTSDNLHGIIHDAVLSFAVATRKSQEARTTVYAYGRDIPDVIARVFASTAPGASYSVNLFVRDRQVPMTGVLETGERYRIHQL